MSGEEVITVDRAVQTGSANEDNVDEYNMVQISSSLEQVSLQIFILSILCLMLCTSSSCYKG